MPGSLATSADSRTERRATELLLACGAIGPPLFVLVFLIEGATRPGYNPWRHFVSQLSTGEGGWLQVANFLVYGLLACCFAVGLRRVLRSGRGATWGPLLLGVYGLGLIVAGVFATDPALGYPPGAPLGRAQTLHGTVHGLAGLVVFSSLPAACLVLAGRFAGDPQWRGWAPYSILTGAVMVAFFVASTASSVLDARGILPDAPTGLLQRVAIILGWGWVALLATRLLRQARSRDAPPPHARPSPRCS
jgi:hypothetical protein